MMTTMEDIKADVIGRLSDRLKKANGRRRERTVPLRAVLACIEEVAGGAEWSWESGGSVANAYNYPAVTTVVLATRVDGRIRVGITWSDAKAISPGRAWSMLQPWRTGEGPRGDSAAKWAAWVADSSVVALDDPEVDALLAGDAA
jgi:hypothetical protein